MFTHKSKRVSLLLIVLALSSALSSCSRYYEEKFNGLVMGGGRTWEVAGRTTLSPTVTEIKLPKDFAVRGNFTIRLYISDVIDYNPKNEDAIADKDCIKVRGTVCLKNGVKATISGSLVDENGEERELYPSIGVNEAANLNNSSLDEPASQDFSWKSYTTLRIRTTKPLTVDHIVIFANS